jgi:acetyltransferase-like isoleucine patch superfamily enzyme
VFNSKENEMGDPKNIDVFGRIRVGNNVFIGYGSIILPNVDIGDNCIIAAGSVVTGNVSSDSVVGGVPAKFIKSIDDYAKSIEHRRVMVRTLSPEMKRAKLEEMFQNDS